MNDSNEYELSAIPATIDLSEECIVGPSDWVDAVKKTLLNLTGSTK